VSGKTTWYVSIKRWGLGTLTSSEGVYDGEWVQDLKHGNGRQILGQKQYSGGFRQGKYEGFGVLVDEEGGIYEGDWKMGLQNGMGHWHSPEGTVYRGEFLDGEFHGQGQLILSNGETYVGHFQKGKKHGLGEYFYEDGEIYKGMFYDDNKHGRGTIIKEDGSEITAVFKRGEVSLGSCCVDYKDGKKYQGALDKQLRPHGKGVMTLKSGSIIPSFWEHGDQKV